MIPAAIAGALTLPRLEADPFVATQWHSAEDKAKFGNHLLRFIAEAYPQHLFTKPFYRLLSNHFGHIAHYSIQGFWDHYFTDERTRLEFLADTVNHWACGDPGYTFSDLEFTVQGRTARSGILEWQKRAAKSETEAIERALLKKLQQKYEPQTAVQDVTPTAETLASPGVQADLFS